MSAPTPATPSAAASRALILVSLAVFCASSTWFSGTAASRVLETTWHLSPTQASWLTNATQYGFILGTLLYSVANLSDRYSPRWVFFSSGALGALSNLGFAWLSSGLYPAIFFRFLTGITLAGVYPVGMKIVASWYRHGLGGRMGVLVACLTLGTAFPFGLMAWGIDIPWRYVASTASALALAGSVLMVLAVEDGPHLPKNTQQRLSYGFSAFRNPSFRSAAFGYFGHMWELYAFWSLSRYFLAERFAKDASEWMTYIPAINFASIAIGSAGCIIGSYLSDRSSERAVASAALALSLVCGVASGWMYSFPPWLMVIFVLFWGFVVLPDSPQLSGMSARAAPTTHVGTALTLQNGLGFLISTVSIAVLPRFAELWGWQWSMTILAIGPFFGLCALLNGAGGDASESAGSTPTASRKRTDSADAGLLCSSKSP